MHSVLGIPVENGDKFVKMSAKKKMEWATRRYLIIDEVSMMDCKLMIKLHNELYSAKSSKADVKFSGFNILFLSDFLQLPCISPYPLYIDRSEYQLGHHLWRSLNAVVILRKQLRQVGDQRLLHCLWIRKLTKEDLDLLYSRIGAPLPDSTAVTMIVRRNELRHALNLRRLFYLSEFSGTSITYCIAKIKSRIGVPRSKIYKLRVGNKNVKGDAILPFIPGVLLMITENIDKPLGKPQSHWSIR